MLWSRRTILALLISMGPVGISIVFRFVSHSPRDTSQFIPMLTLIYMMLVIVLIALFYGTAIIADEVDGRTVTYLFMRPLRKARILLSKFLAYWVGSIALVAPSHLISTLIISTDPKMRESLLFQIGLSCKYIGVISLGLLVYGAIFSTFGVRFKHPVLWGSIVAFGWEKILLVVPGNIKKFSAVHYLLSIYPRYKLPAHPIKEMLGEYPPEPWLGFVMLVVITVLFLYLSIWMFQRREYHID
ncbi:MAG: ABC transporter permease subunit [Candidatus Poribacteria bacterium]|nr:ABC transporter permease subunit [Candidatus Poribacteria bacterium]